MCCDILIDDDVYFRGRVHKMFSLDWWFGAAPQRDFALNLSALYLVHYGNVYNRAT